MAVLAGPLMAQPLVHIAGTVRAGQVFRKEIGPGLVLVLTPIGDSGEDSGWTIEVQPLDGSDNFVRCVTLPLHGPTQADVLSTQFVTEDNRKLPEAKLSDVKKREFRFVFNATDQKKACDEMEDEAYGKPKTAPDGTVIIGNPGYEEPPLGSGSFLVKTVQLSNLGPGKHARLDSLSFEVEIALPAGKNRSSRDQR
ncbi:MAG TPA: hypothetical protein VES66_10570 [Terriglobales bacterium]|nr:hypothetical protein [Terriglobales bacterium]